MSHMYCDLALIKENVKELFLVNNKIVFHFFYYHDYDSLYFLKFGSHFFTVAKLRVLFVLLKIVQMTPTLS